MCNTVVINPCTPAGDPLTRWQATLALTRRQAMLLALQGLKPGECGPYKYYALLYCDWGALKPPQAAGTPALSVCIFAPVAIQAY